MNRISLARRLALGFVAALLTASHPVDDAWAAEKIVLRTDFPAVPIHSALFLAQLKGWYKDAGLDVEIQDGHGSTNTIQLVGAGQIDVAYVAQGSIMPARESGMKIKSFAAVTHKSDLGLIYDPTRGISSIKDIKGKKFLCFSGSAWTPFIEPFLKAAGLDPKEVNVVNVDVNAMWSTYSVGQGDGVFSTPPWGLALVQPKRPSKAFIAADYGVPLLGYGLIARDETIAARPEALAKLAQVVAHSWDYIYNGHLEEGIEAIPKARPDVKLAPETARYSLELYKQYFYTPESKNQPLWMEHDQEWAKAMKAEESVGMIKPGHKTSEFYTDEVIKHIKPDKS